MGKRPRTDTVFQATVKDLIELDRRFPRALDGIAIVVVGDNEKAECVVLAVVIQVPAAGPATDRDSAHRSALVDGFGSRLRRFDLFLCRRGGERLLDSGSQRADFCIFVEQLLFQTGNSLVLVAQLRFEQLAIRAAGQHDGQEYCHATCWARAHPMQATFRVTSSAHSKPSMSAVDRHPCACWQAETAAGREGGVPSAVPLGLD